MVFRRRNNLRPINSLKHVVDIQGSSVSGGQDVQPIVNGSDTPVSTSAIACNIGAKISSLYINLQCVNNTNATATINNFYWYIVGNPGNNIPSANLPRVNEVGTSNARKQIFHQEMAMLSDANDSIPITTFKGVIRVPRKFQRIGVDDRFQIVLGTPVAGAVVDYCMQIVYKEYR